MDTKYGRWRTIVRSLEDFFSPLLDDDMQGLSYIAGLESALKANWTVGNADKIRRA